MLWRATKFEWTVFFVSLALLHGLLFKRRRENKVKFDGWRTVINSPAVYEAPTLTGRWI
jgi:hypothetical protein